MPGPPSADNGQIQEPAADTVTKPLVKRKRATPTVAAGAGAHAHRHVNVVHRVHGRARLKIPVEHRHPGFFDFLQKTLCTIEGMEDVVVNSETGSLLLNYLPHHEVFEEVLETLREADIHVHNDTEEPSGPAPERARRSPTRASRSEAVMPESYTETGQSHVANQLSNRLAQWDASVATATHGLLDLKLIVPLGLGGLALAQILRDFGEATSAPWYVLLYYAVDAFSKLHQPHVAEATRQSAHHARRRQLAQAEEA